MNQTAQTLLSEFGQTAGIEGLAFDDNGYVLLTFDDMEVSLEQGGTPDELLLHARVGEAPRVADGPLYGKVLEANFAAAANGLGTLALDRDTMQFIYVERIALQGLRRPQFEAALQRAVDQVEFWRTSLDAPFFRAQAPAKVDSYDPATDLSFTLIRV